MQEIPFHSYLLLHPFFFVKDDTFFILKESLGHEPSEEQLATSLKISCAELQLKLIECALAREKLAMSNVRLVMSIARRYDNMGAEMADLIQGGLIGLLWGIEKFDSRSNETVLQFLGILLVHFLE
ncbi:RNA polymerase sigma factor sigA-like isoform X2 [Camellia sinensis]|uniref:RNA polymerase sigma factor sigA-like isoform X2 n=1 Tax=Camellia sinensis TaxID=4442 RepID=UPI001035806A|nr:RNA polymerase sigma factor sigA-like isoform X2 [Camellia sinensis]